MCSTRGWSCVALTFEVRDLVLQDAKVSTLAEYFDEEGSLDYTKGTEDVHLPGDLYNLQKKGATARCALSMMHQT